MVNTFILEKGAMLNTEKCKKEQEELATLIDLSIPLHEISLIGAVDYAASENTVFAVIGIFDAETMKTKEVKHAMMDTPIPYLRDYSSYRFLPCVAEAFHQLESRPDIFFVRGEGILHPRRFGIASHFGLMADIATIGVSKELLCGIIHEDRILLGGNLLGHKITTKEHANPLYVSPGHKISPLDAKMLFDRYLTVHKLPEPLHIVHKLLAKTKREIKVTAL
ncbi:MAG: deoxyribonuclease V [archaeon GW2011_AR4]|nr:MAG: deoxyribonuclease V [archaeon GW2011_AR4]